VASFAVAASGSGITPWQIDFAALEEEVFVRAISQPASYRNLTVGGRQVLARQFRERVQMRQTRTTEHAREGAALVGSRFLCAFGLHALLPVPESILKLESTDPAALSWLSAHWGVTDRLRQVMVRDNTSTGRRLKRDHAVTGYGFFTDGETPHAAVRQFEKRWAPLRFLLQPRPAD
jgi:hypothetical protein